MCGGCSYNSTRASEQIRLQQVIEDEAGKRSGRRIGGEQASGQDRLNTTDATKGLNTAQPHLIDSRPYI